MKILYLQLKNFATIYTAMNRKEITIDFTQSKNRIILLVGPNGSGKTSILSTLHPFAYSGNMDVRANTNIIIEGCDGYKEIHIQDNDIIYKIQHHYKYKKNGTIVKSFIQKNGVELNPNGNVTSFNETIQLELSLELDFLRLLRLGSNVSNLIDMKATERKNFTSDLLSDINVYNELFKKISDDNRVLRSMIRTVSDKLTKLNVVDVDLLQQDIEQTESKLRLLSDKKSMIQQDIGSIEGKISLIIPEGIDTINKTLIDLESRRKHYLDEVNKKRKEINKFCVTTFGTLRHTIQSADNECTRLTAEIKTNSSMLTFYTEKLSDLYNKLSTVEDKEKMYTSATDYHQVVEMYRITHDKIQEQEKMFKDNIPIYTKDNLMVLLGILQEMDFVASKIYEFDSRMIDKAISLIKDGANVTLYANKEIRRIDQDILKITSQFKNKLHKDDCVVLFKPSDCVSNDCPYLFLYDILFSESDEDSKSLETLRTEKDHMNDLVDIDTNISHIFRLLSSNKYLIEKGNIPYFKVDSILSSIQAGRTLFNEDVITNMISIAEEYEDYLENKSKLKELSAEIKLMNSNQSTIDAIMKEKQLLHDEINGTENEIRNIKSVLDNLNNEHEQLVDMIVGLERYEELLYDCQSFEKQFDEVDFEIKNIHNKLSKVSDLIESKTKLVNQLKDVDWEYNKLNQDLINDKFTMKEFDSLSKERDQLNSQFEDIALIKESLSSTKGIPLLFIQLYLKNTKMYVNELLEIIFDGEFEIDDFDINSTEFNIPYIKNNIRVNDVVYASQGERSFLSLALSFALITQSIKKYNILLLDEIDSTLDIRNRAMFLDILEKQMQIIDSEQVFLITHNNMFDNYDVDIILTGSNNITQYTNANIIEIK